MECDREVCSIVSGEDEELKYLDVEPEHSKQQGGRDSREHRSHEPEIQNASQVPIEGIKEPTALINRLAAVSCQYQYLTVTKLFRLSPSIFKADSLYCFSSYLGAFPSKCNGRE